MSNYIEFFYDNEDRFIAQIHKNGRVRTITNRKNLEKLIEICYQNGYDVQGEGYIDSRVLTIARQYEEYINTRKSKLKVFGNITNNMKMKMKSKANGHRILAILLSISMVAGGYGLTEALSKNNNIQEQAPTYHSVKMKDKEYESAKEAEEDLVETVQEEINNMVQEQSSFHFSYQDRSNSTNMDKVRKYQDIFEKYANIYGVDPNLLMAIAAQESGGDHYNNLDNGPACGIMQIEKSVHIGEIVTAYNFETGEYDTFEITEENIKDIDTNIRIGAMILRDCIRSSHHNIFIALQTYNFGYGNMNKVLRAYEEAESISKDQAMDNRTNNGWLKYRNVVDVGDDEYLEHVLSYMGTNEITIKDSNGNPLTVSFTNDYLNEKTY